MEKQKNFRRIPKIDDLELQNSDQQNIEKKFFGLTAPVPPIELMHLVNRMFTKDKKPIYSKEYIKKIEDIGINPAN